MSIFSNYREKNENKIKLDKHKKRVKIFLYISSFAVIVAGIIVPWFVVYKPPVQEIDPINLSFSLQQDGSGNQYAILQGFKDDVQMKNKTGHLTIPTTWYSPENGPIPVQKISQLAFSKYINGNINEKKNCHLYGGLTIPYGITTIGDFAFYHQSNITSISLSAKLISIGISAFQNCYDISGELAIYYNSGLLYLDRKAFQNCKKINKLTFVNFTNYIQTWPRNSDIFQGWRNNGHVRATGIWPSQTALQYCQSYYGLNLTWTSE